MGYNDMPFVLKWFLIKMTLSCCVSSLYRLYIIESLCFFMAFLGNLALIQWTKAINNEQCGPIALAKKASASNLMLNN